MPKHRTSKKIPATLWLGILTLVMACVLGTLPFMLMMHNASSTTAELDTRDAEVSKLSEKDRETQLQKAEEYNKTLLDKDAERILGEATDPFSTDSGSVSSKDAEYNSMLAVPNDGIMARVQYPSLGIDLPVYHGTAADTLEKGAGHMYGTSLPVGGTGTHAVISAHTGYADKLMFDRLGGVAPRPAPLSDKAKVGDVFYITVMGKQLGYKVTSIDVIEPDDFSHFGINPVKDEVTLMTCTPYGVNTHRLLVTGERVPLPEQAPLVEDAPKDNSRVGMWVFIVGFWLLVVCVVVYVISKVRR